MKIAIAGATGNIGARIVQQLDNSAHKLVLLSRNIEAETQLKNDNIALINTDIANKEQVIANTKGVDALFWMVPPLIHVASLRDLYQTITSAGVEAVKENKIKKVVLLSAIGAGAKEHLGTVSYVGDMEKAFDTLNDVDVLALRPGYFMENFLMQKDLIVQKGIFNFPYDPEHDIPFISTDDIADAAAKYLVDKQWSGHWKLHLMGKENLTMTQIAQLFSKHLNKTVRYEKVSINHFENLFRSFGANEVVIEEMVELFEALGDPNGVYALPRTFETTTATSFSKFIQKKFK
ncbi:NAD(P)H-binding protein [Sphingobacterium thalpophilum]|uniref:NmrA family NAD(P)-binding protein n=1 Tax=Sphingobacterium thalpophilum TaxID=259 RepID=UPI0024A6146E|nr:NAD(P)H-binding protein [Sphingobacterium thalpophilum]